MNHKITIEKIIFIFFIIFIICWTFTGCTNATKQKLPSESSNSTEVLPEYPKENEDSEKKEITEMFLTINEKKIEVSLAKNSSVDALIEILKQGNIVYTAKDYGGFEKVGELGYTLPTNNTQITTQAGDVILYSGNQIVLFYGSNSWSYTRLGRINGYSISELSALLCAGKGNIQVTISLT